MKKYLFESKDVLLVMQDREYNPEQCYKGCLSFNPEQKQLRFEQAAPISREQRNPKIFAGEYVSLVHQKDGRYRMHLRSLDPKKGEDIGVVATRIALEIQQAAERMK